MINKNNVLTLSVLCLLLLLLASRCFRDQVPLFFIEDAEDLLFLAESTNLGAIPRSSLPIWLRPEEVSDTEAGALRWELWEEVYRDSSRHLRILFKEKLDHPGRHYEFLLRSYALDGRILATDRIGKWIVGQSICYGHLSPALKLTTTCEL